MQDILQLLFRILADGEKLCEISAKHSHPTYYPKNLSTDISARAVVSSVLFLKFMFYMYRAGKHATKSWWCFATLQSCGVSLAIRVLDGRLLCSFS